MKWIDVLKVLGPAILALTPGAQVFIPLIIAGIELAEKSGQPGAEKRVLGADAVKLGAQAANTIAKRDVVPVEAAGRVYENTVDVIVGVTNIIQDATAPNADAPVQP